jgi:hypothetical protein
MSFLIVVLFYKYYIHIYIERGIGKKNKSDFNTKIFEV